MLQKSTILFLMLILSSLVARAYDFSATVASGQTLYFNYIEGGVEVTHPSDQSGYVNAWKGFTKPTGSLTIPTYVSHEGTTYSVLAVGDVAFYGCSGLTGITVSEGVSMIDNYAFSGCSSVTGVHLPSTLLSVGNQSFAGMTSLTDMWLSATLPPTTHTYTFYETTLANVTLHVECTGLDAYVATEPWSSFDTVVSSGCKANVVAVAGNAAYGTVSGGGVYDVGTLVTLVATPFDGYTFSCWNDSDTSNPRIVNVLKDTSFVAVFVTLTHDSIVSHDTVYVTLVDTVKVSDTVYLTVPVHDTVLVHDTLYYAVPTHDTVYHTDTLYVEVPVYDTLWVADTVVSVVTVRDTLWLHDTIAPTFFNVKVQSAHPQLGVGVGSGLLPAGVVAEVCGLPLEGARFVSWEDGSTENPRSITVTGTTTLTAHFEHVGIAGAEAVAWTTEVLGRRVTLQGAAGQRVRLYDMQGRMMAEEPAVPAVAVMEVPAAGVYLLRVGEGPARRIVVTQ